MEDPRPDLRLLSWEYEDCCAARRGDVTGVDALLREARWNERPRAKRQHPDWEGADRGWDDYGGEEGISVDEQSMNGDCEGFWKGDDKYMDCRRTDRAWKGKGQDTEDRNYRVNEREGVQYRDCNSEMGAGRYREDRVPGRGREGGRRYREDRSPAESREGGRCYKEYRDPRDYSEGEGRYGERERQRRQDRGSRGYREEGRQYVDARDQAAQEDFEQHRQPKGHVMHRSDPAGGCEAPAFAAWSSGDSSTSLESGSCYRQSRTWDVDCNGCGGPEGAALDARAGRSRVRTGRPDWSHIWEAEEDNRTGSLLQRNSFYRRTAPSTLRHSEFVQTRKEKRGRQGTAWELPVWWPEAFLHPALVPRHTADGTAVTRLQAALWGLLSCCKVTSRCWGRDSKAGWREPTLGLTSPSGNGVSEDLLAAAPFLRPAQAPVRELNSP